MAWLSALTAARSGAQAGGAGGSAAATPCTGPDTTAAACHRPYGGDLTRATIGFEQIGSSGLSSDQRFSFDFFISRLIPALAADNGPERHYLGGPLRWWGDVRLASYPQAVTDGASAFVTGFATSAGDVKVGRLVQSGQFTTGLEWRLAGSPTPVRSFIGEGYERFALVAFGGLGAVGPFPPLAGSDLPVFTVPDSGPQRRALLHDFASDSITTKYVAFQPPVPDRFLPHVIGGFRLYTFYTDAAGEPLPTQPAIVSIAAGRNDLISPSHTLTWNISASYPFALGPRGDPSTLIVYLFGDVWTTGTRARFSAARYQLAPAMNGETPVAATDPGVTIVTTPSVQRDTYRVGVSVDLLKVWQRLAAPPSSAPKTGG